MFLECFFPDPFDTTTWIYQADQSCFIVGSTGKVVKVPPASSVAARAMPIRERLEELAEEMLAQAASLNEPASKWKIRARYRSRKDLDVDFGRYLHVRGREVAVPEPEWLGRFCSNPEGGANLVLFNPRTVIPVAGPWWH